jgi:hypothetical protein
VIWVFLISLLLPQGPVVLTVGPFAEKAVCEAVRHTVDLMDVPYGWSKSICFTRNPPGP